jgi:exportin-T
MFYLFHRFVRENKTDIPVDLALTLIEGIRDLLLVQVEMPEPESEDQPVTLEEAVNNTGLFDSQLYLFETVGTLLSLLCKTSEQHAPTLLSIVEPLLEGLSTSFQAAIKDSRDVRSILEVHHIIIALGNIAKGFPDFSTSVAGHAFPPLDLFAQIARAILVCLESMNTFKVVRNAVSFWPHYYTFQLMLFRHDLHLLALLPPRDPTSHISYHH